MLQRSLSSDPARRGTLAPPLRILIVAGSYPPDIRGGGEISTRILAKSLVGLGCSVTVLTCGRDNLHEEIGGVSIHRVRSPNLHWNFEPGPSVVAKLGWHLGENWNPRARRLVDKEILAFEPDVVVTSTIENFGAEVWRAAAQVGIPCVHILRSYFPFCWRGTAFRNGRNCTGNCVDCRALSFGRRQASHLLSGVIGISHSILDRHRSLGLFRGANATVIGNPIDWKPAASAKQRNAALRFGYLGILSPNKGLELLAEAWCQARPEGAKLLIAGTGAPSYEDEIRIAFPADTEWCGWVESRAFLERVDYLIIPSIWHEPFGRIVVEAFASGVPVIAATSGGIPEIVTGGRTGLLFRSQYAASLAITLNRAAAISDQAYHAMSVAASMDAARYAPDLIATQYLSFLNEIVGQHSPDARVTM